MHETMLAQNIAAAIRAETDKHEGRPVGAKISCGFLSAVNDELLLEAFGYICKGTSLEEMKLYIEHRPIRGVCQKCSKEFNVELSNPKCVSCGSEDFELLPEAPVILEEIEFETAKNSENKSG